MGEALDNSGLAHAWLANEHRVVFRPPRQDLDDPTNLLVAADHGVQLALLGQVSQIAPVPLQRLVSGFRVLAGHTLISSYLRERLQNPFLGNAVVAQDATGATVLRLVGHGEQQVLGGDEVVLQPVCFALRFCEHVAQPLGEVHLAAVHLRQLLDLALDFARQ